LMGHPRLTWIDHHGTAISKYPATIDGYRIDGVAACRLAWQWFTGFVNTFGNDTSVKEDFVERRVTEPWAVRLAGEYDIWDRRDPDAQLFQHGLRSEELDWGRLLDDDQGYVQHLLQQGKALQYARQKEDASIINGQGFDLQWEGLRFLALNSARCNSLSFEAGVKAEHDALLAFKWTGDKWMVSLYHVPHETDLDLSTIAVKYGGGGHKGACGFTCKELPFTLEKA